MTAQPPIGGVKIFLPADQICMGVSQEVDLHIPVVIVHVSCNRRSALVASGSKILEIHRPLQRGRGWFSICLLTPNNVVCHCMC